MEDSKRELKLKKTQTVVNFLKKPSEKEDKIKSILLSEIYLSVVLIGVTFVLFFDDFRHLSTGPAYDWIYYLLTIIIIIFFIIGK